MLLSMLAEKNKVDFRFLCDFNSSFQPNFKYCGVHAEIRFVNVEENSGV